MTVGLRVGKTIDEIGAPDFLHAFFSTICHHLENDVWGGRYPEVMNQLYQGTLPAESVAKALADLCEIRTELEKHPPSEVVWDIEDMARRPPWGGNISDDITSLGNYFVTSAGEDLFNLLFRRLAEAERQEQEVRVEDC